VGEIRDPETANIAVQSALTGHSFFTTVHAKRIRRDRPLHAHNVESVQLRLRPECDPGATPGAPGLPHCGEDSRPDAALLKESGLTEAQAASFRFRTGRGCRECRGSGYKGRKAIAELMILTTS